MNCAKKKNVDKSTNDNTLNGGGGATTGGTIASGRENTAPSANGGAVDLAVTMPAEPVVPKATAEDSFKARQPEVKEAKRADEIVEHGLVPRRRADYKTMNISTIDFDQSISKAASNMSQKVEVPPPEKKQ